MNTLKLFLVTLLWGSINLFSYANNYTLVVEGFDWGPCASKVILPVDDTSSFSKNDFTVFVQRNDQHGVLTGSLQNGERKIVASYVSDANGNRTEKGTYLTLVLFVSPDIPLCSPMAYLPSPDIKGRNMNQWVDYNMTIVSHIDQNVWNNETRRIHPLVDDFTLDKPFEYGDGLKMNYAYYTPRNIETKRPLIIWLHGGGEGGYDTSIPLMANRAANYASDDIQNYFDGAYVLSPQSPTWWMMTKDSIYTRGAEDDVYYSALMDLINEFATSHSVDKDRIYVGGCSNGGYMSLKLITEYPDYFAAAYISALATHTKYISDLQIKQLKKMSIWFVHSADDGTTIPDETVVPLYHRLIGAGAKNVHFSYFDHVIDQTGLFGGDDYHFFGHSSWNYVHTNNCTLDYDKKPVEINGNPVTIMQWLSMQKR